MSSFAVVAFSSTMTNGAGSIQAEILFVAAGVEHHYETSAMISLCGAYSTVAAVAKPEHSRQNPATSGWRPPGGELLEEAEKLTGVNTFGLRSVVSSSRWQDGLKDSIGEALTGLGTVVLRSRSTSCESWKRSC
jgi:hypothetical protein